MESYLAQIMDGVMNFVNDPVRTDWLRLFKWTRI
jgi:hypothetical protein